MMKTDRARILSTFFLLLLVGCGTMQAQSEVPGSRGTDDALPFTQQEYHDRQQRAIAQLDDDAMMVVRSNPTLIRTNDIHFVYRQNSNLLWLVGIAEPETTLLLLGRPIEIDGDFVDRVLFIRKPDPVHEVWEGKRLGPAGARELTGLSVALPSERLDAVLDLLAEEFPVLYDRPDMPTTAPIAGDPSELLDPLRLIKSEAEIEHLRRVIAISIAGHRRAIRRAVVGMSEFEIEADMEYEFHRNGAEEPAYPSIVGSGPNTCILHYASNRRFTEPGDLVLMDCGAELRGYAADITRTFPISGTFSPEQRTIYELVLRAQKAAIEECRPGNTFWDPYRAAAEVIADGLLELGITESRDAAAGYMLHGVSHFLGLDVHDVGKPGGLRPGMILTVEPGIYIPSGSNCDKRWWDIGVRIEDDILVTEDGPENLSADLEREVDEIEAMVGVDRR